MKRIIRGAAVAAFLAIPGALQAQVTIGPELAIAEGDLGIGGQLGAQVNSIGPEWGVLADFIIFFPDVGDYFEANANLTFDIPIEDSNVVPFLLGGLNIGRASFGGLSATEVGLNLGGGIDFDLGSFRPTAGVRAEVGGGEATVIFFSLPFQTGGN